MNREGRGDERISREVNVGNVKWRMMFDGVVKTLRNNGETQQWSEGNCRSGEKTREEEKRREEE